MAQNFKSQIIFQYIVSQTVGYLFQIQFRDIQNSQENMLANMLANMVANMLASEYVSEYVSVYVSE